MELLDGEVPVVVQPDTGYIVFGPDSPGNADNIVNLSPSGDLAEAAASLYEAMRRLDAAGFRCIQARCLPDQGLGRTVNDRLRRAATP